MRPTEVFRRTGAAAAAVALAVLLGAAKCGGGDSIDPGTYTDKTTEPGSPTAPVPEPGNTEGASDRPGPTSTSTAP